MTDTGAPADDAPTGTAAPFGSWASPITAELIVQASVGLGGPAFAAGDLWWSELRPTEAGRVQIVRKPLTQTDAALAEAHDVLPDGFSARTRVHEYGGGAWWLHAPDPEHATLFFTNWADQRLYRLDHAGEAGRSGELTDPDEPFAVPTPITPEPAVPAGLRYADGIVTADGEWIVCVREWHGYPGATEARNELVAIPTDGSAEPTVLVGGARGPDFVSNPRLSPDGRTLCWIQWDHPNMPWDSTELWVADFDQGSHIATPVLEHEERIAGGPGESVIQPVWDPRGRLHFVSDRADWWNVYFYDRPGRPDAGADSALVRGYRAEFASPPWVFGQSSYAFTDAGDALFVLTRDGRNELLLLPADTGLGDLPWVTPYTSVEGVTAIGDGFAAIVASFRDEPIVVTWPAPTAISDEPIRDEIVQRPARDLGLSADWYSVPEHLEFPTSPGPDGEPAVAYGLFYPPRNPDHHGPDGALPPLLVLSHGGPTGAARPQLNLSVQFWTSRGFAVVDVNYRGSVGYGRAYRDALKPRWGIADVEDCIAAARHLAATGRVDGDRLAIRGGSAGGYTTLCALTFHDDFRAGCSLYGVADLEALAKDTHKFESRYLDYLIGPYPEDKAVYDERSPIHHTALLTTPIILLQGLEDEIVPPAQAEMMVAALTEKAIPHAYLAFEGEQHGFRQAPNIRRALEAELYFYGRVLGFDLHDDIDPVPIPFL